jgi:hypothetical protein
MSNNCNKDMPARTDLTSAALKPTVLTLWAAVVAE